MSMEATSGTVPEDDPEEESYFTVYLPEPTEQEMLRIYEIYRAGGGDPYEPYEHMLVQSSNAVSDVAARGDTRTPVRKSGIAG